MKNELIIAQYKNLPRAKPERRLNEVLDTLGLGEMRKRFYSACPSCQSGEEAGTPTPLSAEPRH